MDPGHFHLPPNLGATEDERKATREFVGDGTAYLSVPGCKAVTSIRMKGMVMPEVMPPIDILEALPDVRRRVIEPTWRLAQSIDGEPVLLRNQRSNHGIWQKDASVYIVGEWEDQPAETEAEQPAKRRGKAA